METGLSVGFVNELPYEGKAGRPFLADGLYRVGEMVKAIDPKAGRKH